MGGAKKEVPITRSEGPIAEARASTPLNASYNQRAPLARSPFHA